jgi:hypothetical protein
MFGRIARGFLRGSGPPPGSAGFAVQEAWLNLGPPAKARDRTAMDAAWESLRTTATAAGAVAVLASMDSVDLTAGGTDSEYRSAMHMLTTAVHVFCKSRLAQAPSTTAVLRPRSTPDEPPPRAATGVPQAFLGVLPRYLGMGVREAAPTLQADGRFAMKYVWDNATVVKVSADQQLGAWQIEDFRPSGERASMSGAESFAEAARLYASTSLGSRGEGPTGEWLLQRIRAVASYFVLIPPDPEVTICLVPAVATVHLLAAMSPGAEPPILAEGTSGIKKKAMPYGVRVEPKILAKTHDGSVRAGVAIALAEYVVPAIDAAQHIAQLCAEPAVVASTIPVIGVVGSGRLEFGTSFADGDNGERWVLDTGPVDLAYLEAAAEGM